MPTVSGGGSTPAKKAPPAKKAAAPAPRPGSGTAPVAPSRTRTVKLRGGGTVTVRADGRIVLPNGTVLPSGARLSGDRVMLPNTGNNGGVQYASSRELVFKNGVPVVQVNGVTNGKKTSAVVPLAGGGAAPKGSDDRRQPTPTAAPAKAAPAKAAPAKAAPAKAAAPARPAAAPAPVGMGGNVAPGGGGFSGASVPGGSSGGGAVSAPAGRPGAVAPAAPGVAAAGAASTKGTDAQVRAMFGNEMVAFLSDPELGPIIRKAAADGLDTTRLFGLIQQTKFWKTKGDTERKWFILNRFDNATARRDVEKTAASIWEEVNKSGLPLSGLQVHDLAVNMMKFGWTPAELRKQMFAVVQGKPGSLNTVVATSYGYLAAFLDHPEVGPLLERAAREGWDENRLNVELQKTNFWKTTTDAQRKFNSQLEQDPASAQQAISARASELLTDAQALGIAIDPVKLKQIAEDSLRFGWNPDQIRRSLTAEFDYQGGESGVAGRAARDVRNRAAQYLVPMSEEAMEQWTEKMVRGEIDMEGFDAYLIEQAKSMFPGMAGALDKGITVAQYADPYKQTIARELELNPESIDLNDPRFRKMLDQTDSKGNRVAMTLSESAEYLRKMPEWQQTRGANEKAASLTENILRTFGATA